MGGGGSILGPVLGFVGAQQSAKAMKSAASEQAAATREATRLSVESQEKMQQKALDAQEKALREQRGYLTPYRTAGTQALYQYLYRIGAGSPSAQMYKAAFQDPTLTSRISELKTKIAGLTPASASYAVSSSPTAATAQPAMTPGYQNAVEQIKTLYKNIPESSYDMLIDQRFGRGTAARLKGTTAAPVAATPSAAVGQLTPEQQEELTKYQSELANLEQQIAATDVGAFSPWNLEESPTYKIQMEDTERAINRGLLARGLYGSKYGVSAISDNARRLAAAEQQAQLGRLQGLTEMGQQTSAGMGSSSLSSANAMTNMYGQGASNLASIYQNMGQGLGDAAYNRGAATAGLWSNLSDLGGRMWQQSANQQIYGPQRVVATGTMTPSFTNKQAAGMLPGFGFMSI